MNAQGRGTSRIFRAEEGLALTLMLVGLWTEMSPLRSARLGEIDDHQYVAMVGRGSRLALRRVPGLVWHALTTFGGRFHPGFDVLLVIEVALVGVNAHLWYLLRAILALGSLIALYLLARRAVRPLSAAVVALLLLAGPQAQTWVRLGPLEGEATAALLVGILLLARWHRDQTGKHLIAGLALVWLAALMKESFCPYALIALVIVWAAQVFSGRRNPFRRVVLVVCLGLSLLPIVGVVITYAVSGDPYARPRTVAGALHAASTIISTTNAVNGWLVVGCFALLFVIVRQVETGVAVGVPAYVGLILAALLVWLVPQAVIYSSGGLGGRYFIPAIFVSICAIGSSVWLIEHQPRGDIVQQAMGVSISALVLVLMLPPILHWRGVAQRYTRASVDFQQQLSLLGTLISENRTLIVRFETKDASSDYEPIMSIKRYIDWRAGRAVPATLSLMDGEQRGPLEADLRRALAAISTGGGAGFLPSANIRTDQPCIGVEFGALLHLPCRYSVNFGSPPTPV